MARVWGFAESTAEVQQRRDSAATIIGEQIAEVTYYSLDYRRDELRPGDTGLHRVVEPTERADPTWLTPLCDSLDFGVELRTATGRIFSITWDPPGWREGMGIQETQFVRSMLRPEIAAAAWPSPNPSRWAPILETPVTTIDLHFQPWELSADQHWCTRVTLACGNSTVVMMLGEGTQDGQITPSADNIAVLFDQSHIPDWERDRLLS